MVRHRFSRLRGFPCSKRSHPPPLADLPFLCTFLGVATAFATVLHLPTLRNYQKRAHVLFALLALEVICAATLVWALLGDGSTLSFAVASVACLIGGYALSIAGLLALDFAIGLTRGSFVVCLCFSIVLGVTAQRLCSHLGAPYALASFVALAVLGTVAAIAYSRRLLDINEPEKIETMQAFERMMLNSKTGWFLLLYGFVLGLKSIEIVSLPEEIQQAALVAAALSFVLGAALALIVLVKNTGRMMIGKAQRYTFPFFVTSLLPWSSLGGGFAVASVPWAFAASAVFITFVFDTHYFLSKRYEIPAMYPLVLGFRSYVKGVLAGGAVAAAATALLPLPLLMPSVQLMLAVALCFLIALVIEEADRTETAAEPLTPEALETKPSGSHRELWNECAETIAKRFSLTPREAEILPLLFRANTTERISDILCISVHTAKTHIYHIYQKVGVGSRSELTDLFEECLAEAESRNER